MMFRLPNGDIGTTLTLDSAEIQVPITPLRLHSLINNQWLWCTNFQGYGLGPIRSLEECLLAARSPSLSTVSKLIVVPLAMFIIINHSQAVLIGLKAEKNSVGANDIFDHQITSLKIWSNVIKNQILPTPFFSAKNDVNHIKGGVAIPTAPEMKAWPKLVWPPPAT